MRQLYDAIGVGYGNSRRPDPRIAAAIVHALGRAETVVNVGAGAGSYEPTWERRYGDLLSRSEIDLGYRLVISKSGSPGGN